MRDLFDDAWRYPRSPGYKRPDTSKEAADKVKARAPRVRDHVMRIIRNSGRRGLTADEVATAIGRKELYIRPRVSELYAMGFITKAEERRVNEGGLTAAVWVAVKGRGSPPRRTAKEKRS